jgi:phosphoribosylcarboxyaminoimidazole (NCAIR) mutase
LYVLEPTNAAIAAAKIIGLSIPAVAQAVAQFQASARQKIEEADARAAVEPST